MKKVPYGIVIVQDDDNADLRKALIDAATLGPFRNLAIHVPPAIEIDRGFGMKFAELAASRAWAIGMAEEAITARAAGDDEADTPDVIAMHREELEKGRLILSHFRTCIGGDAALSQPSPDEGAQVLHVAGNGQALTAAGVDAVIAEIEIDAVKASGDAIRLIRFLQYLAFERSASPDDSLGRLREALTPFAAVCDAFDYWVPEVMPDMRYPVAGTELINAMVDCPTAIGKLTEADFRRAREALVPSRSGEAVK